MKNRKIYLYQFKLRERKQSAGWLFLARGRSLNKKIPRENGGYSPPASFSRLSRGRNNFSIVTSVAGNSLSLSLSPSNPSSSSPALCRKIGGSVMNGHWTAGEKPDDGVWRRCKIRIRRYRAPASRALSKWRAQWDYSMHSPLFSLSLSLYRYLSPRPR